MSPNEAQGFRPRASKMRRHGLMGFGKPKQLGSCVCVCVCVFVFEGTLFGVASEESQKGN